MQEPTPIEKVITNLVTTQDKTFGEFNFEPFDIPEVDYEKILRDRIIPLNDYGFTLTSKDIPAEITPENFGEVRTVASDFVTEGFVRAVPALSEFIGINRRFEDKRIGRNTPDLIFDGSEYTTQTIVYESKTTLFPADDLYLKKMQDETDRKYAGEGRKVIMIHFEMTSDLPKKFMWGPNLTNLYLRLLRVLLQVREHVRDRKLLRRDKVTLFTDVFGKIAKEIPADSKLGDTPLYTDYCDPSFKKEWIRLVQSYVPFYNYNYMHQTKAAILTLQFLDEKKENISSLHPFSRKYNGDLYKGPYSHKANNLISEPLHKDLIKGTFTAEYMLGEYNFDKKMKKALEDNEDTKDFAGLFDILAKLTVEKHSYFDKLKQQQREFAYLFTEANRKSMEDEGTVFKDKLTKLKEEFKQNLVDVNVEHTKRWRITRQGYIRINLTSAERYYLGINRDENRYFKEDEDHLDWKNIDFKFESIYNCFPDGPGWNLELQNFYPTNPALNLECDTLLINSQLQLNRIFASKGFGMLDLKKKFFRSYLLAFPGGARKKVKHNDFAVITVPDHAITIVATAPVGITSGCIIVYCKLALGTRFPEGWLPYAYYDKGNETYAVSKPFRIQMDIINTFDESVASWVSLCAFGANYGLDHMHLDPFFHSFWWNYVRMLNMSFDIMYLLYKNSFNYGTLGRWEYPKKFTGLVVRDVRVATILRRLRDGYKPFVKRMQEYVGRGDESFLNITDPVLQFTHQSLQTLFIGTYLKQVPTKHDAFDEAHVAMTHFMNEEEFRKIHKNSAFNPENGFDVKADLPLDKFVEMDLKTELKEDGTYKVSWSAITFNPGICYSVGKHLIKEGLNKDKSLNMANNFMDHKASAIGKNSRVLFYNDLLREKLQKKAKQQAWNRQAIAFVIDAESDKVEQVVDIDAPEPGRQKGMQSVPLTEGLFMLSEDFKIWVKENKKMLDIEDIKDDQLDSYSPVLSDLIYYCMFKFPKTSVLTLKVKDQKGYDKRIFFIQTVDGMVRRKFADESLNKLLKAIDEDMIMQPGDQKNVLLEKKLKKLNIKFKSGIIITEDQTKYGDLYPLDSFYPLLSALRDAGYYTTNQADFMWNSVNGLKKRVVLAPPEIKQMIQLSEKYSKLKPKGTRKGDKFWKTLAEVEAALSTPNTFEGFDEEKEELRKMLVEVKENGGIRKDVGFVLGVFNKLGSVLSAGQLWLQKFFFELVGLGGLIDGATHSDDSIKIGALPPSDLKDMSKVSLDRVFKMLYDDWEFEVSGDRAKVVFKRKKADGSFETSEVSNNECTKFAQVSTLPLPKLVGQRPSLTKWGAGPAGEVLQSVCLAGKMIPPIMRFANAIGADLQGQSPANDLYSAVGRVYQLASNGMHTQGVSTMMLIANWFVFDRFGYHLNSVTRANEKIPELGGFIWFYPPMILSSGFYSNELRLLAIARSTENNFVKQQYLSMMDTDEVFQEKTLQARVNLSEEVNAEVVSANNEGSVVAMKDITLRYSRNEKAQYPFSVLGDEVRPKLERFIDKLLLLPYNPEVKKELEAIKQEKKLSVFIKSLANLTADRILSKTGESQDDVVNFLKRYLLDSYQFANARVPNGVQRINMLGYDNRQIPNQFSTSFRNKHRISNKPRWTVREFKDQILSLCDRQEVISTVNIRFLKLIFNQRSDLLDDIDTMEIEVKSIINYTKDIEYSLSWEPLRFNDHAGALHVDPGVIVAAYIQSAMMSVRFDQLPVIKSKPQLFLSSYIFNKVLNMKETLAENKFTLRDVLKNPQVFSKIFEEKGYFGVFRSIYDVEELKIMAFHNYDFKTARSGILKKNVKRTTKFEGKSVDFLTIARGLSVAYSLILFEKAKWRDIEYVSKGEIVDPDELSRKLNEPWFFYGSGTFTFNTFLLNHLRKLEFGTATKFKFFRYKDKKNPVCGCLYGDSYFFLEYIADLNGVPKYRGKTTTNLESMVEFFFGLINYFMFPKSKQYKTLGESIALEDGNFMMKGANELQYTNGLNTVAIKKISTKDAVDIAKTLNPSKYIDNSLVIKYGTNDYFIQVWDAPRVPCKWTFKLNGREYSDDRITKDLDEQSVEEIGIEMNDSFSAKVIALDSVPYQLSLLAVNVFRKVGGSARFYTWKTKAYSEEAVEVLRYIHYTKGSYEAWIRYIKYISRFGDLEIYPLDSFLGEEKWLDDNAREAFNDKKTREICEATGLTDNWHRYVVYYMLQEIGGFTTLGSDPIIKAWEVANNITKPRMGEPEKALMDFINSAFHANYRNWLHFKDDISLSSFKGRLHGNFNKPKGYSTKLLHVYLGLHVGQASNMLQYALSKNYPLLRHGQIDQALYTTLLLNYKSEAVLAGLSHFDKV